jgi:ketosteroid isomerase-like protein
MTAPTTTPFGEAWIAEYFAEVDRMDPDGLLRWYAGDARFRFGNAPAAEGKAAIAEVLRGFYGAIRSMRHRGTGCWVGLDSGVWEAEVTFVTKDGAEHTLPAVSVLRLRDGLVADFRFVMDPAPLGGG